MYQEPVPIHRFLATAGRDWGRRKWRSTRDQCSALASEISSQSRQATASIRQLFHTESKAALLELGRGFGRFLFETFILSPVRLVSRGIDKRTLGFMCAGLIPLFAAAAMIAVPAMIFDTPDQKAYFFFARMLQSDSASLIPMLLGVLSLIVALRIPLHAEDPRQPAR